MTKVADKVIRGRQEEYVWHAGKITLSFLLKHPKTSEIDVPPEGLFETASLHLAVRDYHMTRDCRSMAVILQDGLIYRFHRPSITDKFDPDCKPICTDLWCAIAITMSDDAKIIGVWADGRLSIWTILIDQSWQQERVTGCSLRSMDQCMTDGYLFLKQRENGEIAMIDNINHVEIYRWRRCRFLWWHYWKRIKVYQR